jgi:hypothetical protein
MKRFFLPALAGALLMTLGLVPSAQAQQAPIPPWPPQSESPGGNPGALAGAALEQLIRALGMALQNLPQYEMPAVTERGDIIIRRSNPPPLRPADRAPANPDEART